MENKKKVLVVFGTRPEAIKMAPLVLELNKNLKFFETKVCVTAQHREMLDQVLSFFEIKPDFDLDLMTEKQSLHSLTSKVITGLKPILDNFKPDFVFVHGDTTTAMATSIAAFYSKIKVCHIEAGLRTFNMDSPFPEEMNRSVIAVTSHLNFAPTNKSKENLLKENKNENRIFVTGNTVIDALFFSVNKVNANYKDKELDDLKRIININKKIILVTGHRRENHGDGIINICKALIEVAKTNKDCLIVYPVHLNPNIQKPVYELLGSIENIKLVPPLSYPSFVWLMDKSYLILTDSGGIQEEAPSLGKPVLLMRDNTERPEAILAGTVILVGNKAEKIVNETNRLIVDKNLYSNMSKKHNPYGDGSSCKKIISQILNYN